MARRIAWLTAVFLTFACGNETPDETDDTAAIGSVSTTDGGTGDGATTSPMTDTVDPTDAAGTGATSDTTDTPGDGDPKPDGSSCVSDDECMSGNCFDAGVLDGVCGACDDDADCAPFGCSAPNLWSDPRQGATCGDGTLGAGCASGGACSGLTCATVFDLPGVFAISTCSECDTDEDCATGVCNPTYDLAGVGGHKACVVEGSVGDGQGCDPAADNGACQNFCVAATIIDVGTLGVCSPCRNDGDCPEGEECEGPSADFVDGIVAGACVEIDTTGA